MYYSGVCMDSFAHINQLLHINLINLHIVVTIEK